ncbi:PucR family transcriptional regulator ligand-binding domain-containing protein [Irregularibacter muris]|uniref:PucR family transcriptional regulator ligand-binding domain-containing protein n=1 Tax=Irregularibacter muris TaxID=1796619 RepID=A0AAE3HGY1_9FIRM|nr:PucR family transcriptional regulator [Irregularibacter muris]MCR1899287.1 PucR family transcriptional regulator ligand-binding domain-containing protein [Irregularibacter muris]
MLTNAGITIEQALKLDALKGAKLIAGERGKGNAITQINIMEVPDIGDWVKGGELLLTTAYSIKDDPIAQKELIPKLHEKGLAGLAIKPRRYLKSISEDMIKTAESLGFPLIELPFEASFTDIMNPILAEVLNKQAALLTTLEEVHGQLMNILLAGGELKDISDALAKMVKNPVAIQDNLFNNTVVSLYRENPELREELMVKAQKQQGISSRYYQLHRHQRTEDEVGGKTVTKVIMPIVAGNKTYGYIIVWETNAKLEVVDMRTIETSSAIAALDVMKEVAILEVEKRHKIEFIEDLLSPDQSLQKLAIERGPIFGLEFGKDYVVMVISLDDFEKSFKKTPNNAEFIQQYKNRIQQSIQSTAQKHNQKIIMGDKSDSLTILLAVDPLMDSSDVKNKSIDLGKNIIEVVKKAFPEIEISIGIGRYYSKIEELYKSYQDAKKSITLGKLFNQDKVVHFDDLGIYRLLYYENLKPELRRFYTETLMPLVEYDKAKDTELVKTLQSYFENNGNLKKISKQLFTHYNTILYRIQRIEEICHVNLQDAHQRLNLEIALKIMYIIDKK